MKQILLILLVCLMRAGSSLAQDLIVTTAGDSIFCKITRERDGYVYFNYIKEGVSANTLIASDSIAEKRMGLYKTRVRNVGEAGFTRWQYRLQGGYSRRIARVSDQVAPGVKDYLTKMKSGYTLGGDIHYFISEPLGLGVKYNFNAYQYKDTDFEDKVKMHYIAISALNRLVLRSDNEISLGVNLGYQSYLDQLTSLGTDLHITGGTLGAGLEAGYAFRVAKSAKAFLNLAWLSSTITKINVESGGRKETIKLRKDEFEGLGRLEVTAGLLFGK
ncbi:porin family protein [Dyadobacter aurulentus]|uniref:porin family protein n=1 Tax=Dyadobacter sp. UC 10 TaxID=2605428 RepID=UPI0011F35B19|nr:porin family protein [Dyadobacter sp. UC 10]KAA0990884.1 porin family protein [Dyadobacter sp. UC 10]